MTKWLKWQKWQKWQKLTKLIKTTKIDKISKMENRKNLRMKHQFQNIPNTYFWTSISVFFLNSTFFAIISVTDSRSTANYASPLITSIIAFIANPDQSAWPHIRIANDATAVTLFAKSANGHAGLFSAKNQVWMMFCHNFSTSKILNVFSRKVCLEIFVDTRQKLLKNFKAFF